MSNKEIEQLRAMVLSERSERKGPFSKALRERLNAFLNERYRAGESLKKVGDQLGLSKATVQYWRARWGERVEKKAKLRRVKVVTEKPATTKVVTLHGPAGTRVDGLNLDEVAAVWRKLQ